MSPRTFARWVQGEKDPARQAQPSKPGRPRIKDDIRVLILKLARENAWGYTRILSELKKLGIRRISRTTVIHILKEEGLEPGPQRGEGTWDEFLKRQAQTLWACDFFSQKIVTGKGFVEVFVLFFLHVGSRRVYLAGLTIHPDQRWVVQQARNAAMHFAEQPDQPTQLLRDHDSKFVPEFDAVFASDGIAVKPVGPRSPNLHAYAERFVQTVRRELLDHFVVFGEAHLRHLLSEFRKHSHECRPHQGRDNVVLSDVPPASEVASLPLAEVRCQERLGGLLKHYSRQAA